ncbi:CDP-glycerol glycerophosphotransferase family protein [Frondihabitans peucedani]|uniref:CDP-glycerol glycerophosphotransferase (TagB/SpsB family) n=1 Tax=Frondihabitans peucedani TaxID=598626 RepID=A0ABP8E580_9MICO
MKAATALRRAAPGLERSIARALHSELRAFWRRRPVDPGLVLFESFDGNGALCNPEALFRALIADPAFSALTFVWSLRAGHDGDIVLRDFRGDPRVRFVRPGSSGYERAVATAGHLVTNATFPRWFSRRPGQVVVNTWHGTPLKKMGFDIGDQPARVANVLRNFLHADYLLSTGPYMTSTMYLGAHALDGLYDGRILEVGSPRVDAQFAGQDSTGRTLEALHAAGIDPEHRQLVLFAPTWKGTNFSRPLDDARLVLSQTRELQTRLGDAYRVVLKAHQAVHESVRGRVESGLLVPNDIPTNAVLAVTDQLVTDYSSIFFDFLTTGRPIHFLVPDIGDYDGYRGLYLQPDTWPGRVTTTVEELAASILSAPDPVADERAQEARATFAPLEDGHATERVLDEVFRNPRPVSPVSPRDPSAKPRVVVLAGGPPTSWAPAQTDAAVASIDLGAVDVTVVVSDSRRAPFVAWQKSLDPRIRVLVRQGEIGGSKSWALLERLGARRPAAHWSAEWTRLFGLSRIDEVRCASDDPFWRRLARAGSSPART